MQQQINLLQPPLTRPRQVLSLAQLSRASAAVVVLLIAVSSLQWWQGRQLEQRQIAIQQKHESLKQSVTALQDKLAQRQPDAALQAELAQVDAELQRKQKVLTQIEGRHFGNNEGFAQVFVGLARQRLDGLWLTGLHIRRGGQSLDLHGAALDPALLPRYLQRLRQEPGLKGMAFERFLMHRPDEHSNHVEFDLRSTPASSAQDQEGDRG